MNTLDLIKQKQVREQKLREAQLQMAKLTSLACKCK